MATTSSKERFQVRIHSFLSIIPSPSLSHSHFSPSHSFSLYLSPLSLPLSHIKMSDIECERPSSPGPIRLKSTESVEKGGGTGTGVNSSKSSDHSHGRDHGCGGSGHRPSSSPHGHTSPHGSKSLSRRRRRRSLTLCESFSDGESTDGTFSASRSSKRARFEVFYYY